MNNIWPNTPDMHMLFACYVYFLCLKATDKYLSKEVFCLFWLEFY